MEKKKRIIIFSHENDIDGLGSIILGKLAFNEIDYDLSSNVNVLETKFRTMLENGELNKYDRNINDMKYISLPDYVGSWIYL